MTTREHLNKSRKRGYLIAIAAFTVCAFTVCASGFWIGKEQSVLTILGIGGFALFFGAIVYMLFSGHCQKCHRRLGHMFSQATGASWRIPADLRYCPYCAHPIDSPSGNSNNN